ncbi:MAG: VTC domain-containing protein [Planctomycetota bacterium]|nr:VTC domain-containing protein [Planctomycetota bacterium]
MPSHNVGSVSHEYNFQELRGVVPLSRLEEIRESANRHLSPDGEPYRVATLYLDTPELEMLHGMYARADVIYRIRHYEGDASVWLERKRRLGHAVSKRRSAWPLGDLSAVLSGGARLSQEWPERIRSEIQARELGVRTIVTFRRTAWVSEKLRLTLDERVEAAQHADMRRIAPASQSVPMLSNSAVIEFKTESETRPVVMSELMKELAIEPQAFSKYIASARVLGIGPTRSDEAQESAT